MATQGETIPVGDFLTFDEFRSVVNDPRPVVIKQPGGLQGVLNNIFSGKPIDLNKFNPFPSDNTRTVFDEKIPGDFTRTSPNVETRTGADEPGLSIAEIRNLFTKDPDKAGGLLIPILAVGLIGFAVFGLARS